MTLAFAFSVVTSSAFAAVGLGAILLDFADETEDNYRRNIDFVYRNLGAYR